MVIVMASSGEVLNSLLANLVRRRERIKGLCLRCFWREPGKDGREMVKDKVFLMLCLLFAYTGTTFGAHVILNEYNAVGSSEYLNGADVTASDSHFGRVMSNGGDWFELVVITDHVDMRGWKFDIHVDGAYRETLNLKNHGIWSDLRSGTIITISEDLPDDISYDPSAGDWWINVQANADYGTDTYIEAQNFPVNNDDWQLVIKDRTNTVKFGPVGEGVIVGGPAVSNTEIFRLEADPSASITGDSLYYDDAQRFSTFGAPNRWGSHVQDFSELRSAVPEPATFLLLGLGAVAALRRRQR